MVEDRNDQCIPRASMILINRRGLCKPSDITSMSCVFAWKNLKQIMNEQKSLFFTFPYPRDTFVHSLIERVRADKNGRVIIDTACEEEHKFKQLLQKIATKYFNCMAKNFTSKSQFKNSQGKKADKS